MSSGIIFGGIAAFVLLLLAFGRRAPGDSYAQRLMGEGVVPLGGPSAGERRLVEAELRKYGVTASTVFRTVVQSRYSEATYMFTGVDKAGVSVSGTAQLMGLRSAVVKFDDSGAGARVARAQGRLVEEDALDEATLDVEEQIRREIGRRLDAMQGDRDAFLANDANLDGMVDGTEWSEARRRIEAEVRAEFEDRAPDEGEPIAEVLAEVSDEGW